MAKIPVLAILGCLFWSLPLELAMLLLSRSGISEDLYYLIGIPLGMIVLTIIVGRFPPGSRLYTPMCAAASCLAIFAAIYWVGIIGAIA
ncbi:MAG: hypothetical protein WC729_05480 [Sphingomonas sp.]|uniref:hypothetical protein n=1 Tax=Sphingomonas sp. TaxID=28214 RepID=UPI003567A595